MFVEINRPKEKLSKKGKKGEEDEIGKGKNERLHAPTKVLRETTHSREKSFNFIRKHDHCRPRFHL